MGEARNRWVSEPGQDDSFRNGRPGAARLYRSRVSRSRLVWTVALVLPGMVAAPRAVAQDEPPKVEAPKSAPLAPAESPQRLEPAPPDVQKTDTAPAEKQKAAPAAPDDAQKAQTPAGSGEDAAAAFDVAEALSTRYRFVERYGIEENPTRPQLITQYRVGVGATSKVVTETPQRAPETKETKRTTFYVERAARVNKLGEPTDLMRRYDLLMVRDQAPARALNPPLLQGLTILYHPRPPMRPVVLSLSPDRLLREAEYTMIAHEVSIARLIAFFPLVPRRVGQTWSILPIAVQSVSGKLPDPENFELTGTLLKVGRSSDGKSLVAQIGIEGGFDVDALPSAFKAQIDFTFVPRGVALPPAGAEGASREIEAAGQITYAVLSHARVRAAQEGIGRLKQTETFELVLERRPLALLPGERGAPVAPLTLPETLPTPNEANSWVTFVDPAGRFHFRHPQELEMNPNKPVDPHAVELSDVRDSGSALVGIALPMSRDTTERELTFQDANHFQKAVERQFADTKDPVTWGPAVWLDDEDWKIAKRKVFRMEAALKREALNLPVYIDCYLVVEANSSKSFRVEAWIGREGHVAFRNQVENIIRSFQWSPAEKRPQGLAPAPAASTAAAPDGNDGAVRPSPSAAPPAPATAPTSPPR
jgi:hypothetical protein